MLTGSGRTPAWVLFLLAPVVGELLSSSAPPAEFFRPIVFGVLCVLYGGGALLVRELTIRWQKGWPSLLALGAAYGLVEEGLMVRSFFDPNWMDLGGLGNYARWWGVNWLWAAGLTVYHVIISISVPILLVELIFPERSRCPWVTRKTMVLLAALLALDVALGWVISPYLPPLIPYVGAAVAVVALVLVARWLPRGLELAPSFPGRPPRPIWFFLLGMFGIAGFYVLFYTSPYMGLPAPVALVLTVVYVITLGLLIYRISGRGVGWEPRHQLALVSGFLSLFMVFAPLREFKPGQPDNTTGMTLVAAATAVFLLWVRHRVRSRNLFRVHPSFRPCE